MYICVKKKSFFGCFVRFRLFWFLILYGIGVICIKF